MTHQEVKKGLHILQVLASAAEDFSPDAPIKNVLYEDATTKAMTLYFRAGQRVPPCNMSALTYFYVAQGTGWLQYHGKECELAAGTLAVVPPGEERSIRAESDLVVLAVQVHQKQEGED